MMNLRKATATILAALALAVFSLTPAAWAGDESHAEASDDPTSQPTSQPSEDGTLMNATCPMSGKPALKDKYLDYADADKGVFGRVYFCCDDCKAGAKEDLKAAYEKAYLTKADGTKAEYGKTLASLGNKTCPGTGGDVEGDLTANFNGVAIGICCAGCDKQIADDPAKTLSNYKEDIDRLAASMKDSAKTE